MRGLRQLNEQLEARVRDRTRDLAESNELLRYREQLLEETGSLQKWAAGTLTPSPAPAR